jgi:hypothetical protein
MSALDQIVSIQISQQTQAVPQQGFGIPLIVGTANRFAEVVRYYTDVAGMLSDGFLVTDPEYIHASKAFSQALRPTQVGIGKYTALALTAGLNAILAASNIWYGLVLCSKVKADIEECAAWVETQKKIFIAASADAAVITSATDDVASDLKASSYGRTALIYSATAAQGPDAAWVGGELPKIPGSSTWKFKTLVGITPDTLTASARNYVIGTPGNPGKNANIYETVGGVPITEEGTMASGKFIDVVIGIDWLESTMQNNVFSQLVSVDKVPYTDQGVALIENRIRETLNQGVSNGLIDKSSIVITMPKVLDQPQANRANRILGDCKWSCRLAGALHFVQIQGTVTV